ncbi:MAG: XdhC family protein [Lachnospiraceae bacterium]|nr:XdhC family protein [Lachnospiraceae bacterium]
MDKDLYQNINLYIKKGNCLLCTVVDGIYQREQILFCDKEIVWKSEELGFLSINQNLLLSINQTQMIEIASNRIFCECLSGSSQLVICGAGHVSIPIIEIGKKLGFHVTVLEDRPFFANRAINAGADEVLCDNFSDGMEKIVGGDGTYFIIVTRGHRYDILCLERVLEKERAYIGMMGSKKRVSMIKQELEKKGVSKEQLDQIHAPIGLDIGSETPEEIAISILAEIIQIRSQKKQTAGYAGELLEALITSSDEIVIASIISRKGSAPRKIGTKMLIYPDGHTVGTIGGGCMESKVIRRAQLMLELKEDAQLIKVDMTGQEAEEEGMVCGGIMEVYLERRS